MILIKFHKRLVVKKIIMINILLFTGALHHYEVAGADKLNVVRRGRGMFKGGGQLPGRCAVTSVTSCSSLVIVLA